MDGMGRTYRVLYVHGTPVRRHDICTYRHFAQETVPLLVGRSATATRYFVLPGQYDIVVTAFPH
jgi:hypothetical protein